MAVAMPKPIRPSGFEVIMSTPTEYQIKSKIRLCGRPDEFEVRHELPGEDFRLHVPNMHIGRAIVRALRERARLRSAESPTWLIKVNYRTRELKSCNFIVAADTAVDAIAIASDTVSKRAGVVRVDGGKTLGGCRVPEADAATDLRKRDAVRSAVAAMTEAERLIRRFEIDAELSNNPSVTLTLKKLWAAMTEMRRACATNAERVDRDGTAALVDRPGRGHACA